MEPANYIKDPAAFVSGDELTKLRNLLSSRDQALYAAGSDANGIDRAYSQLWGDSATHGPRGS